MKMHKQLFLFLLLITAIVSESMAQPVLSPAQTKKLVEKTFVLTDRDIYCVDELINFTALNISSPALKTSEWSSVLYVELIAPDGQMVARRKCAYDADGASGTIKIPTGTITGNYYLKAYTRWMRDFSSSHFFYKPITVINPFRPEILEPFELAEGNSIVIDSTSAKNLNIKLISGKEQFSSNEQASFSFQLNDSELNGNKITLSVIPEGSASLKNTVAGSNNPIEFTPGFIPETRGLSISGRVVAENDSIPMAYTLVGLTVFKDSPEMLNVRTNEKGQFFFDLSKLTGEFEIFISAKAENDKKPLILVDNDFSNQSVNLPFIPLNLDQQSKELYQKLAFTSQIHTLYQQQVEQSEQKTFVGKSFYGNPEFALKLADYVALPSISEYFYELVPLVKLKREAKHSTMKVLGNYPELAIYDPLVLLDMVPIFDVDKLLELDPEKIDRIEVMTAPYIRGDIIFGGIISLFSVKGDMAGVNLPDNGRFINYSMFSKNQPVEVSIADKHTPDMRNCLYWNPDLQTTNSGKLEISFNTGNNIGRYWLLFQSVDSNGKAKVAQFPVTIQ